MFRSLPARNLFVMAVAAEPIAAGEKALQLGKGDNTFGPFFRADVQKTVDGWKKGKA